MINRFVAVTILTSCLLQTFAQGQNYIRGVNLGSWFVPELWMVEFYEGTNATDMCSFSSLNRNEANERMVKHLSTWIIEDDFVWLKSQGVNSVRLPLGYWDIIDDYYNIYVPVDKSISISYIDKAFDWAEKYNMSVLLDLHGAPGSQNGADHSGCGNGVVGWDTETNRAISVQAISALASRYSNRPNLLGFELLNEPAWSLEDNHNDLLQYYKDSYKEIRKYSKTAIVSINVLYSEFYDLWDKEFPTSEYSGIVMDWHLYDCFGGRNTASTESHIAVAESWGEQIATHSAYHPIFVGEWSMGTGTYPGGQGFADAQETSFANGIGFYFWSLKLTEAKDSTEWSFQAAIKSGLIL